MGGWCRASGGARSCCPSQDGTALFLSMLHDQLGEGSDRLWVATLDDRVSNLIGQSSARDAGAPARPANLHVGLDVVEGTDGVALEARKQAVADFGGHRGAMLVGGTGEPVVESIINTKMDHIQSFRRWLADRLMVPSPIEIG